MRIFLAAMMGAASLAAAPMAFAQGQEAVASKSSVRGVQALQQVGHCLANDREALGHELVTIDYRSDRYKVVAERLGEYAPHCNEFRRGLRTSGLIFAGTIVEGLLLKHALLDDLAAHTAYDPDMPPVEARSGEDVMAYCVVRKAPVEVSDLLRTTMTSDEEMTALKALAGVLPTCVPEGQQPKFTREALRAIIALSAYRLYAHNLDHRADNPQ
ncbi:hypothetical protein [Sphingomicrobium clamense]|uniref:Secreted protein n=1 Tax=Sphingomicrobium clamense TaxID=2851013 RepID=A0ABS6V5T1_9SPHN|nr:hypothetical protein [Sphingomicrobium sp. B8]MBW0144919.1 hypothetical protein [Sphingomicrobium sp. B8]